MREARSPVRSSKKCGLSQRWWPAMTSALDPGSMDAVGNDERSISITREIVTSPSFIVCIAAPSLLVCAVESRPRYTITRLSLLAFRSKAVAEKPPDHRRGLPVDVDDIA